MSFVTAVDDLSFSVAPDRITDSVDESGSGEAVTAIVRVGHDLAVMSSPASVSASRRPAASWRAGRPRP